MATHGLGLRLVGVFLLQSAEAPATGGLASRYHGDVGIEAMKGGWDSVKDDGVLSFSPDVPPSSAGTRSLLVTHEGGSGPHGSTGGHLYRRLLPGYEKLHLRYYTKFDPDCWSIHHFARLGGCRRPTTWLIPGGGLYRPRIPPSARPTGYARIRP